MKKLRNGVASGMGARRNLRFLCSRSFYTEQKQDCGFIIIAQRGRKIIFACKKKMNTCKCTLQWSRGSLKLHCQDRCEKNSAQAKRAPLFKGNACMKNKL